MAKPRGTKETYWTPARLKQLLRDFNRMNQGELCRTYKKSPEKIRQAYEFAQNQKILLISRTKIKPDSKTKAYTYTIYAAGFASGIAVTTTEGIIIED